MPLFLALILVAGLARAEGPYGAHPGYVSDVQKELHTIDTEVVLIDKPLEPASENSEFMTERLSNEFRDQFKYKFGVTEMQQSMNSPGRSGEALYYTGKTVSLKEYQLEQRHFGEYMSRRLMEYHVDRWAKANPSIKPVYELKDKMTNLNMEVKKGYKMKVKYSLSGGNLDFNLDNPYDLEARVRLEMGTNFLSTKTQETIISFGSQITPLWSVNTLIRFYDGVVQVVGTRKITPALSTSITGLTDSKEAGPNQQENLILVGFTYTN